MDWMFLVLAALYFLNYAVVSGDIDSNCTGSSSCGEVDCSDDCTILCYGGCDSLILNCYSGSNCTIVCMDCSSASVNVSLFEDSSVNLQCSSNRGCESADVSFASNTNSSITVGCNNRDSCKSSSMDFASSSNVVIGCYAQRACQSGDFDARDSDSLDFIATASYAARYLSLLSVEIVIIVAIAIIIVFFFVFFF